MVMRTAIPVLILVSLVFSACSDGFLSPAKGTAPVSLSATFTTQGTPASLGKGFGILTADSIEIDSAVVVFSHIEFESEIHESDSVSEFESEMEVTFKGPFVVHVRNSEPVTFTSQILPAATYNSIKLKIHRLSNDDHHYDSDDSQHRYMPSQSTPFVGSSIRVWGRVRNNGVWQAFAFETNMEAMYRIRGTFVVDESIQTIPVTLTFNIGSWFVDRTTGALLDPTDTSSENMLHIHDAIRHSFRSGSCGRDNDRDGRPDDRPHYDDSY